MASELAAGYCGERTVEDFLRRVGKEYAKRNLPRALSATRKRHAHVLANASETSVQNSTTDGVQNEKVVNSESI
jgi:hypothetical protein